MICVTHVDSSNIHLFVGMYYLIEEEYRVSIAFAAFARVQLLFRGFVPAFTRWLGILLQ